MSTNRQNRQESLAEMAPAEILRQMVSNADMLVEDSAEQLVAINNDLRTLIFAQRTARIAKIKQDPINWAGAVDYINEEW